MKLHCSSLKRKIIEILRKNERFHEFQRNEHVCMIFKNPPHMPLVIEKHIRIIKVARLLEIDDKTYVNPELELWVGEDTRWYPALIRYGDNTVVRARYWREGKEYILPTEVDRQINYSSNFASTLSADGF